ncbi:uncharacterized protein BXZ73DRAFT_99944 [Epithele typhae]|uniref:uncharacterized protein n=1 Tax=Epithele typhae TaxID=378194 RepID=UPI002007D105|nr:uncharacterized protein BXZ73DRAFT_99944 [Epithele typhae]KAH9938882.1 hypothetical protein BXZ73DRAFT_99944 [Epithele typhae]
MASQRRGPELQFLASPWVSTQVYIVILSAFFFGITVAVTSVTVFLLLRGGLTRRSHKIQLLSVLLLFVSTLLFFLFTTVYNVNLYTFNVQWDIEAPLASIISDVESRWGEHAQRVQSGVVTACLTINIFISDATVWWRACMLWPRNALVRCMCFLLLASTLGIGLVETYTSALSLPNFVAYDYQAQLYTRDGFGTIAFVLSLTNNVVATALIAFKAWRHARILRAALGAGNKKSRAVKMLSLLIESGVIYCVVWLFIVISAIRIPTTANDTSVRAVGYATSASILLRGCLVYVIGLYPMLIVVIVRLKHSQLDNVHSEASGTSIRFGWPEACSRQDVEPAIISIPRMGPLGEHEFKPDSSSHTLTRPSSVYVSAMSGEKVADLRRRQDRSGN